MKEEKPKVKGVHGVHGRPAALEIKAGQTHGHLYVHSVRKTKAGVRALVECLAPTKPQNPDGLCHQRQSIPLFYLRRKPNPKYHCGCIKQASHTTLSAREHYTKISWQTMFLRCENVKHVSYHHYGGRGIKICDRWQKTLPSLQGFINFFEDMGRRPQGKTLDRIDNDLGYFKDNCRWATPKEQRANQR